MPWCSLTFPTCTGGFGGKPPRNPVYEQLERSDKRVPALVLALDAGAGQPRPRCPKRTYPALALFITQYGAEANRTGPIDEKGPYAFRPYFLRYQLSRDRPEAVHQRRPSVDAAHAHGDARMERRQLDPEFANARHPIDLISVRSRDAVRVRPPSTYGPRGAGRLG